MVSPSRKLRILAAVSAIAFGLMASGPAFADTFDWANWTSATAGNPGTAAGTVGSLTVTYAGQNSGITSPNWGPTLTFAGGSVTNGPAQAGTGVQIEGGPPAETETITFSAPVVDPVMSIISLGQGGIPASFYFTSSEPFTIEAGGPSLNWGGTTITKSGDDVLGTEGSGTIMFNGTFSSITFTTPTFEDYYAITVGYDATATSATPEPGSLALLGTGLLAVAGLRRRIFGR